MRRLLNEVERRIIASIGEPAIVVGILPTGYGKTSVVRKIARERSDTRVLHVLPLRAIVEDCAKKAREEGVDDVGYQASVVIEGVTKSPYFASRYTITTLDSFSLMFAGVPIAELYRDAWHSDVAFTMARSFDLVVFDEFHLMVSTDAGVKDGQVVDDYVAKQAAFVSYAIADLLAHGSVVAILSATIPPSLLKYVLDEASKQLTRFLANSVKVRLSAVVFGEEDYDYVKRIESILQGLSGSYDVEVLIGKDDQFVNGLCGPMKLEILEVPYANGYVDANALINALERKGVASALEDCRRVLMVLNSWRRCVKLYRGLEKWIRGLGFEPLLLHGKMSVEQREEVLREVESERVWVVSTQVVEAGVDRSFDALITEIAPAFSLVQRCGRVSRYSKPSDRNLVAVIVPKGSVDSAVAYVYSVEATKSTLDKLEELRERGRGVDWRGRDALDLVMAVDSVAEKTLSQASQRVAQYSNLLRVVVSAARTPMEMARILDGPHFEGSFVRSSALAPIVAFLDAIKDLSGKVLSDDDAKKLVNNVKSAFIEGGVVELSEVVKPIGIEVGERKLIEDIERRYVVPVSVDFLARYGRDYLELVDGEYALVLLYVVTEGRVLVKASRVSLDRVAKSFVEEMMWIALREARLSGVRGVWKVLGFLAKFGVFDRALGLLP